jgi:tripartite-type tricarboxylate transporter receptor subunit TctC
MSIKQLFTSLLAGLALCAVANAQPTASFATKPVRIIVPYPPGGGIDILARALAPELSQMWAQPVVVENIAGASGIIGTEKVATAAGDGHTLMMTTNPTVVGNRFLFKSLPYDPDRQLAPITMVVQSGQMALAHPSLAANSMKELVDLARRTPGKVTYSSYGNGTQPHLFFEAIAKREGVEFLHVPYKGIAPAGTAVVAGEVMLTVASPAQLGAMVKAGKLKALAIGAPSRAREFPSVPTTAEAGFPYAQSSVWYGMFAPATTPPALVERISRDIVSVARRPEFSEKHVTSRGLELVAGSPSDFAAAIRTEVVATGEMVKAAGVKPE